MCVTPDSLAYGLVEKIVCEGLRPAPMFVLFDLLDSFERCDSFERKDPHPVTCTPWERVAAAALILGLARAGWFSEQGRLHRILEAHHFASDVSDLAHRLKANATLVAVKKWLGELGSDVKPLAPGENWPHEPPPLEVELQKDLDVLRKHFAPAQPRITGDQFLNDVAHLSTIVEIR
jgi:hypothetical protein